MGNVGLHKGLALNLKAQLSIERHDVLLGMEHDLMVMMVLSLGNRRLYQLAANALAAVGGQYGQAFELEGFWGDGTQAQGAHGLMMIIGQGVLGVGVEAVKFEFGVDLLLLYKDAIADLANGSLAG